MLANPNLINEKGIEIMKIFLAGGISGNIRQFWDNMKVHMAAASQRGEIIEYMKLFLAGNNDKLNLISNSFAGAGMEALHKMNILESYYYLRSKADYMPLVKHFGSFLLDSGAFTFMSGTHNGKVNWDAYVEEYAVFINKYDVKLFFELDIDSIVGIAEVERLRSKLEDLTSKKPIPVWHKSRGKEYFIKMCQNYPYVALGGIVTKEIPIDIYESGFPWFIKTARQYGAKIHGLGYTRLTNLHKYHFDSVDSTAWLYGNRGGYLYKFNPQTKMIDKVQPKNFRLKPREGAVHNFTEWLKFSEYAEQCL